MSNYKKTLTYFKYAGSSYDQEPEEGWFAYAEKQGKEGIHRTSEWYDCRESFHIHFHDKNRRPNQFLFFCEDRGERVARFIEEAEKRLNVEPHSEILGFKNVSNVCCIFFSKWWKKNDARWQLFTILLRCGLYYQKSFKDALYSDGYITDTEEAVERFFNGYTHFTDKMDGAEGWVHNFNKDEFLEHADYEIDFDYHDDCPEEDKLWKKQLNRLKKPNEKPKKVFD